MLVACAPSASLAPAHDASVAPSFGAAQRDAATDQRQRITADSSVDHGTSPVPSPPSDPWPFVAHAVERCYVDRLARSPYLLDWVDAGGLDRERPEGDPAPSPALSLPSWGPRQGDPAFASAREGVLRALSPDRSHVMDCTALVRDRDPPHALGAIAYTAYLPRDYLRSPRRTRGVLLMVPGGRGDRTRWFLTAAAGSVFERGTGGLSLRAQLDRWADAHRTAAMPVVVTVDGPTGAWIDGREAWIGRDLPAVIAQTYLPHIAERSLRVGVQAISIGAAVTMRAAHQWPERFDAIALMGMFCDARGLSPERDFGADRARFYQRLASRIAEGSLAMRMSIGRRDALYECNKRWYFELQRAGLFAAQREPAYERCAPEAPESTAARWARWPGFTVIPRLGHHYAAVVPIFEEDLAWQLARSTRE